MLHAPPRPLVAGALMIAVSILLVPRAWADLPTVVDEHYRTACGPIACLVALRSVGVDTSLEEVIKRCDWDKGKLSPFDTLESAVKSYRGIDGRLAHLSPKELCRLLEDDQTAVILAVRKDSQEICHAVCALEVLGDDGAIRVFDYPELLQERLIADVVDTWDGQALVVRTNATYRAFQKFTLLFAPLIVCVVIVGRFVERRQRRTARALKSNE